MRDEIKTGRLESVVEKESLLWGNNVARSYHKAAANDMDRHWNEIISPILGNHEIDYSTTLDFACGYGRNTDKLLNLSDKVIMVDVNNDNIDYCRHKYRDNENIEFILCNGYDLGDLQDGEVSFLYSFDSMVHFDVELIFSYFPEFARILRTGGKAFFHHSNFQNSPGSDFRTNPHWRNYMSSSLFKHIAIRSGFGILQQSVMGWGGVSDIDCITILELERQRELRFTKCT